MPHRPAESLVPLAPGVQVPPPHLWQAALALALTVSVEGTNLVWALDLVVLQIVVEIAVLVEDLETQALVAALV